jgi:hypothetical protein
MTSSRNSQHSPHTTMPATSSSAASPSAGGADPPGPPELRYPIRLLNTPVRLLEATRQYHDELMNELSLLAAQSPEHRPAVPPRLLGLTKVLGRIYGEARGRFDAAIDAALARGAGQVDLSLEVSGAMIDVADRLEELMSDADELCRTHTLLTPPRPHLLVQFSHWFFDEFRRQIAGLPPRPWDGPLAP